MNSSRITPVRTIKKLHIETAAIFAINNIPGVDEDTLQKFVELINVTGNFGAICEVELLEKMRFFRKYIPKACGYSLYVLTELLEIASPAQAGGQNTALITAKNEMAYIAQVNQPKRVNTLKQVGETF